MVNDEFIKEIVEKNFSRIPVYYGDKDKNLVFGVLFTKSLIGLRFDGTKKLSDYIIESKINLGVPMFIHKNAPVQEVFQRF